jgi:hypothetical protein
MFPFIFRLAAFASNQQTNVFYEFETVMDDVKIAIANSSSISLAADHMMRVPDLLPIFVCDMQCPNFPEQTVDKYI